MTKMQFSSEENNNSVYGAQVKNVTVKNVIPDISLDSFQEFFEKDFIDEGNKKSYSLRHYHPWAKKNYGDWLMPDEKVPLTHDDWACFIKGTDNEKIFNAFTEGQVGWNYWNISDEDVEIIKKEFNKDIAVLKEDIIVHRVTNMSRILNKYQIRELKKGQRLLITRFLSTGLVKSLLLASQEKNGYDTYIKIYAPKGSNCLFLGFISHIHHEQEMFFNANQTMKIMNVQKNGDKYEVTAIILP